MVTYNTPNVMFLVNSFKDVVDSCGKNNRTVYLFKGQVEAMVLSRQITPSDRDIAFEILGITNTNNVKWSVTSDKILKINTVMNMLSETPTKESKDMLLGKLVQHKHISEQFARLIKQLY